MNRRDFNTMLGAAAVLPAGLAGAGAVNAQASWSLAANVACSWNG